MPPQIWIGLDWGDQKHSFALQEHSGHYQEGTTRPFGRSLHQWLQDLGQRYGSRVALGIETSGGAVIHALVQYPGCKSTPINPVTSALPRSAFQPSGAKD